MSPQVLASRAVDEPLQTRFAALTGDRNPMHVDPVTARRTQAGAPVVHGVHTLLWALESLLAAGNSLPTPFRLRAKFLKWVYLGDTTSLTLMPSPSGLSFQVDVLGMQVVTADVSSAVATPSAASFAPCPAAPSAAPHDLTFAHLEGLAGEAYTAAAAEITALFPRLCALLGTAAVAELAATSYVVGMLAPGLHSMFSKLDLIITPAPASDSRAALHYAVASLDPRFRKSRIAVSGAAISGTLEAFVRVPPVQQATLADAQARVSPHEFAHVHALIIGGSRGLGEVTAKLIAAGGGTSTITYAMGKAEAESVARQIGADTLQYDVRQPPAAQLPAAAHAFTHMLYFATNAIFRPKHSLVSPPILADFLAFYIQGFYDLCVHLTAVRDPATPKLEVYYPSSIAVEERPQGMTEYAMVKAAGEQMCLDMNAHLPGLHITTTRLPRLPTDQTTGVLPERGLDPLDVMLAILRDTTPNV